MKPETLDWIFSDSGSMLICAAVSVIIGFIYLIAWFFSNSKESEDYIGVASAFIFGAPIVGPIMFCILSLIVCIAPFYLIYLGLSKLRTLYHKKDKQYESC